MNTFLQSQVADTHDDITNVALATASAVAQAIAMNPGQYSCPDLTPANPTHQSQPTDPEPFDRSWDKIEEFIQAIGITVTMWTDTFADERMKILYALSFMHGDTAQVWAANKTVAVINRMSQMQTLNSFVENNVEKIFRDPDRGWMAHLCQDVFSQKIQVRN